MAEPQTGSEIDHRQLGVDLYNSTWKLLEQESRTPADDDEMLNATQPVADLARERRARPR